MEIPPVTIVVTGRDGQLGSELCRQLGGLAVGVDLPEFDLTNPACVRAALQDIRPTAVVNTAAYTLVDRAETERDRCWAINAEGVARLADACRQLDCRLIQISTDYVFDGPPVTERAVPRDGRTVATGRLCPKQARSGKTRGTKCSTPDCQDGWSVRTPRRAFRRQLRGVDSAGGEPGQTASSGQRPAVHADLCPHLARAIRYLLESDVTGLYHITNSGQATWYEVAREDSEAVRLGCSGHADLHGGLGSSRPAPRVLRPGLLEIPPPARRPAHAAMAGRFGRVLVAACAVRF